MLDPAQREVCVRVAPDLFRYALRWVVESSPDPADAVVVDAAATICLREGAALALTADAEAPPSAVSERMLLMGREPISRSFTLPVTLTDAVAALACYGRRYAHGRGTTAARDVNDATRALLEAGVDLSANEKADGTLWAVDAAGGEYDGLNEAERRAAQETRPRA